MPDLIAARTLLGCRPGACRAEVQRVFRAAVRRERPDLGGDGAWLTAATAARDVLLEYAGPDRRRTRRTSVAGTGALLRRATWRPGAEPPRGKVDVRL